MPPAARLTDMHVCPMVTVLVPHVGGPILPPCAMPVLISGLPAARITDLALCVGPPDIIVMGSMTVIIQGMPAARMLDLTAHGGMIVQGDFTTWIGDAGSGSGGGGAPGLPKLPSLPQLPALPQPPALPGFPAVPAVPTMLGVPSLPAGLAASAAARPPEPDPGVTPRPPLAEEDSPEILERRAANQVLMESDRLQADLAQASVTPAQLQQMLNKECPLGFESPEQFQKFRAELQGILRTMGLDDAQVEMKGTSTAFFSENPRKELGHFFDKKGKGTGDFDIGIASQKMVNQLKALGKSPHPDMPHIYKTRDLMAASPALQKFSDEWSATLKRDVNLVAKSAPTLPGPAPTDYRL